MVRHRLDLQVKWECNAHVGSVELSCNSAACVGTEKPQTGKAPVCATSWLYGNTLARMNSKARH